MIVYFTTFDSPFAEACAYAFAQNGHQVITGCLPERMDLFVACENEKLAGDDIAVCCGIDPDLVMESVRRNLCAPIKALESALPALDAGALKRVCFLTSGKYASVNQSTETAGYGYAMAKAALSQALKICYNKLSKEGYTFRLFDPMQDRADAPALPAAAFAAYEYFTRMRAYDPDNRVHRNDDSRFVLRDAMGREIPW